MIVLETPLNALPIGVGRNLNRKIAAVEALQLIGGFCEDEERGFIANHAPQLLRYADHIPNGERRLWGAYGRRIGTQLNYVAEKIQKDVNTRQAVITLWDPSLDNQVFKSDYPCTLALQFRVFKNRLCMMTTMRSNDAWLGLPYDMFQFTQLQLTLANSLGIEPGPYTHFVGSMHLYITNANAAMELIRSASTTLPDVSHPSTGIGLPNRPIYEAMDRARRIAAEDPIEFTASEAWYVDVLNG